ncbi:MAG: PQQ-binding-like beta-propeller repeat protein [Balneolaceae bacterium]
MLFFSGISMAQPQNGRYLYLSMPDAAQSEGRSGPGGLLVFDIDNGHEFVRRIEIPVFDEDEGLRGLTGNLENHSLYYSTTNKRVGAFDLESEEIIWDRTYEQGADRSSITMNGEKIYVPTGWWYSGDDSGMLVLDAENGELIDWISVAPLAHNSIVSLDDRRVYLGAGTTLSAFDTETDEMIWHIEDVGERGVFPFTIDSEQQYGYVCLGGQIGFDVVNLQTGEALHRVVAVDEEGKKILSRTHGAGLTVDESELWISDQNGQRQFIFDATQMPPTQKGHVELSDTGHGWVTFSLDGRYAWGHTPDVFDAETKELIATLEDEYGNPVSSSKFIEVHFRDGKVVEMSNEFALGRKNSSR